MASIFCKLADRCSGCDRLHLDRDSLEKSRREELHRMGLGDVPTSYVWIGPGALRDRLEFTIEPTLDGKSFGLYDQKRTEIVDIEICPQLSPELQNWLTDFHSDLPAVSGPRSIRLRVSPTGKRGVWLDFSNEDILAILNEESWLSRQLAPKNNRDAVIVEVGQRRKRIVANPSGPRAFRLVDPTFDVWFETPVGNKTADLFSTIGTFTQPGFKAAHRLVQTVLEHVGTSTQSKRIAEFGAGIGCFTLPLLATGAQVDVFESDRLALSALEKGVDAHGIEKSRLTIHAGDFILSSRAAAALRDSTKSNYDVVVVDPPRPGLGTFIDSIHMKAMGAKWVYVSCYPKSFAKDAAVLTQLGLKLNRLTIVEQFPFTRHFEIVASFSTD